MKRNKHILINLSEDQYNALVLIAKHNKRKIADQSYLILIEQIEKLILPLVDKESSNFKSLVYNEY